MNPTSYMRSRLIVIVLLTIALCSGRLQAQQKPYNEEITVIAAFDPIIPDAFKISQNPVLNDTTTAIPKLSYSVMPRDAHVQLEIEQLPAVKLVAEPLTKLYRNYLKAGVGNYTTLYGELFASSLRSKEYLFGIHIKHLSSEGNIKEYGPAANSTQVAELFGQKYFDNHTLSGKAFLNRDGLHYYGYRPNDFNDTIIGKDDLKQRYLTLGAEMNFSSRYKSNDKLNHVFGISYYHLADKFEVRENNIKIRADLDKQYDLFKWDTKQKIGLNSSLNIFNQKDSINKITASILNITPTLSGSMNEYSFKVGLGFNFGIDTVTKAHLYPMIEGKIDLVKGALQLYAGIDGGMERNSIRSLSISNPYISSGIPLDYTYNKFRAYGGFNGNISRTFNINGSISSTTFENYPFFASDTNSVLENSFTLLYDDITMLKIKGELEFVKAEKLRISLAGGYYSYNPEEQDYAWYKPDYDFSLTTSYNFQEKIILKLQATYNGPVWAPVMPLSSEPLTGRRIYTAEKIKGWMDVSLGTEYKLKKALSFWLNINNITASQHFYWHNYPSYRLNLMAGLSYSF